MTAQGSATVGPDHVVLFVTCLADSVRPSLAEQVLDLLRRAGADPVLARGATCCGQPAFNAGFNDDAARVATRTVRALDATTGTIVVPSGSCTTMLLRHLPHLLAGTRWEAAAQAVAGRVQELSTYLADRLPARASGADDDDVAYHDSCHMLRELGEHDAPRALLSAAGHPVREMPGQDRCCGFGGTFSVKLPAISVAMADEKLDEAVATGARVLASCDLSCVLHLEGRARRRGLELDVCHLAEILS